MENGNGGGVGGVNHKISCDDVISKLKDDGDFDRLRLKIIRKLKENEELRNSIVSIVKQSVAINRPGAETMKPRQLSDAIHQEVGGKLNEQISDGLWEIIRSADGMKSEITETVKSVYDQLSRPKPESSGHDPKRIRNEHHHKSNNIASFDSEPKEPLGFSHTVPHQIDIQTKNNIPIHSTLPTEQQTLDESSQKVVLLENPDTGEQHKQQADNDSDDEYPDAPPGFG